MDGFEVCEKFETGVVQFTDVKMSRFMFFGLIVMAFEDLGRVCDEQLQMEFVYILCMVERDIIIFVPYMCVVEGFCS